MAINTEEFLHLNNLISKKIASEKDKENFLTINYKQPEFLNNKIIKINFLD